MKENDRMKYQPIGYHRLQALKELYFSEEVVGRAKLPLFRVDVEGKLTTHHE